MAIRTRSADAAIAPATAWVRRVSPRNAGMALLVVAAAHFVMVPGHVIGGQRYGWDGELTAASGLNPLIAWLIGSLVVAYIVLCEARAALSLLGRAPDPPRATRYLIRSAIASLAAVALMWPGMAPAPSYAALLPLASATALLLCVEQRRSGAWPSPAGRGAGHARQRHPRRHRMWVAAAHMGRGIGAGVAVLILAIGTWFFVPVSTPPIVDAQGQAIPGSIATMEQIELNGTTQWIVIRGRSVANPILLVLAGGPGSSAIGDTRTFNAPLEDHFTVVSWEQPGSGKSFPIDLTDNGRMTPAQYVSDGLALTAYLRARFHQDKIYLWGSSWGSYLGVWMVQQQPQWFTAYIGQGQMTSAPADDRLGYDYVLQHARADGDTRLVNRLERNGPPPYDGLTGQVKLLDISIPLTRYEDDLVREHGGEPAGGVDDKIDLPEYRPIDMVYALVGPLVTATTVYPQLDDIDLAKTATTLKVPVFFAEGRYDLTAMTSLALDYFNHLKAPSKTWVWFDQSGHSPSNEEAARFNAFMVNTVLAETRH